MNPALCAGLAALLAMGTTTAWGQSNLRITNASPLRPGSIRIDAVAPPGETCLLQATDHLPRPFADLSHGAQTARVDGSVTWIAELGAGSQRFYRSRLGGEKQLLAWSDIAAGFQGTFGIPLAEEGDFRFGYSSGVHAQLTNGNLLIVGHPYYNRQAQVQIPTELDGREGTRVGPWIDITGGLLPSGWSAGEERYVLGGMLEAGSRIYFTQHQWYNGAGVDWQTQGFYEGGLDGAGAAFGMWTVAHELAHHSRVGGYMSAPPAALEHYGYAYLAGLQGTSGAALGRWGPNLFAIRPVVSNGAVEATALLCHPTEALQAPPVRASNATSEWWVAHRPANEVWWIANKVTDMKWIETDERHGVLCFVYRGIGQTWYGDAEAGPGLPDPYGGTSGFHAEGWALQAWIYDPADVLDVFEGSRDPWSLTPAEVVLLTERLPGSGEETQYSMFTGSARADLKSSRSGNRLIVLQENEHPANEWESTPKGYVFLLP